MLIFDNLVAFAFVFVYNFGMNFFVNSDQIENGVIYIRNGDVNHIKNVLRKNVGDVIDVVSDGCKYRAEIAELGQNVVRCLAVDEKKFEADGFKLTFFQGLAKADKIEYIIQKCTELGVYEVVPVEMKRCVVRLDGKDKVKKLERWSKIAEVASKQSLRNDILRINRILSFSDMCIAIDKYDCVILAYEKEKNVTLKSVVREKINNYNNVAVIIGPEGGIDDEEAKLLKEKGAKLVSLGKRILRTETAPVAIASISMYEIGE